MYITTSTEKRIRYSVGYYAHNSVWTCKLGYGADTMFHRTYFLLLFKTVSTYIAQENHNTLQM